jgi:hypothetical protein
MEKIITVYVGDVSSYLSQIAQDTDINASPITGSNYQNLNPGIYYTSIGDLDNLTQFSDILRQADLIVYAPPPDKWSNSTMMEWTEDYLTAFADKKNIQGFHVNIPADRDTMLNQVDTRKTDEPQLWIVGCSVSHGIGVDDHQRYGQLLAEQLNLPVSFLTCPGSSLTWAADQLLRADIKAGDAVVWGLTSIERFPYWKNNRITHVNSTTYVHIPKFKKIVDISFLDSQQLVYQAITEIHQVINFCNKVGAKLILAQLLGRGLEKYLHDKFNYRMLCGQYGRNKSDYVLDLGTDNNHPGPITHQYFASEIFDLYQTLYEK